MYSNRIYLFSKVIYASDIGPSVNTFGWSISAGMDLDGNQYPDIVVGAAWPRVGQVVLL